MTLKILKSMNIEMTEFELSTLTRIADKDDNGVIEYKEFIILGAEFLHGLLLKQQTENKLSLEDVKKKKNLHRKFNKNFVKELYLNQACWVLFNDDILEIGKKVEDICKKVDEDKNEWITFRSMKEIIEKVKHDKMIHNMINFNKF